MELKSIAWYCFILTLILDAVSQVSPPLKAEPSQATPKPPVDYDIAKASGSLNKPLVIEYW